MGGAVDFRILAIVLAVFGAVALAFGAQYQNDAVGDQQGKNQKTSGSLNIKQVFSLLKRPKWLAGTGMIVVALGFQITALSLAPLIVVQPVGAIALVITSLLNARVSKTRLNRPTIIAIGLCVIGIGSFVAVASTIAHEIILTDDLLWDVLVIMTAILIVFGILFFKRGHQLTAIYFITGAGVIYGFVATLTKVIIQRILQGHFEWLTVLCAAMLIVGVALGGWFVQNAYSSGPPDLVIAGLTVIDPMVAVLIAATILGEAQHANAVTIVGFLTFAAIAISGVLMLSQFHPQILLQKRRAALWAKRRR
ncbi:MAG: multidrug DMT transporter permease [Micrococcales bacterium]